MNEANKYNTYKHRQTVICWATINVVLTIAYLLEFIKSNRSFGYVLLYSFVTWCPYFIFVISKNILKLEDELLEYIAGIGYMFFYTFTMITGQNDGVFCYIFPMFCILVVYSNKLLNIITMGLALIINIFYILMQILLYHRTSAYDITFYEIQIACISLCTFFLWRSSSVLLLRDKMISALSTQAFYDALTKIHNRMYLTEIEKLIQNNIKQITSMIILDIDDFKHINDNYGHQVGDEVLIKLAELMNDECKKYKNTVPVRFGGDEFIIISFEQPANNLYKLCTTVSDRIRIDKVKNNEQTIDFTISAGVIANTNNYNFSELYEYADKALYDAKENGKNKIVMLN